MTNKEACKLLLGKVDVESVPENWQQDSGSDGKRDQQGCEVLNILQEKVLHPFIRLTDNITMRSEKIN